MTGPRKRYMTYVLNQFSLSGDTQISLSDMLETLDEESISAIIRIRRRQTVSRIRESFRIFPKKGRSEKHSLFSGNRTKKRDRSASALEEAAPESRGGECAGEDTCEDGAGWPFLALGQPLV